MATTQRDYIALSTSLLNHKLRLNSYSLYLRQVIAVGAFGVLFLAEEYDGGVATCRKFAVKCLLRSPNGAPNDNFILREKSFHPAVCHPNVVRIHAVIEQGDFVYLVMDFFPDGDLFKAIVDRNEYVGQDEMVRDAFLQVATGLQACHARGIFHRDIKPENILVRSGYPSSYPRLALADFGLCTNDEYSPEFGVGSSYYMSLGAQPRESSPRESSTLTRYFYLPFTECGSGVNLHGDRLNTYSSRSNDVWSLGILLINLSCGRNPWVRAHFEEGTFASFLQSPDYLLSILPISSQLNELLKLVFRLDPEERITLDEMITFVSHINRFTLDWNELCCASEIVRAAAGPLIRVREKQEKLARLLAACDLQPYSTTYSPPQPGVMEAYHSLKYAYDVDQDLEDDWGSLSGDKFGGLVGPEHSSESSQAFVPCGEPCCSFIGHDEIYEGQQQHIALDACDASPTLSHILANPRSSSIASLESFAQQILLLNPELRSPFHPNNASKATDAGVGIDSPDLSDSLSLPSTPGGPMTPGAVISHVQPYVDSAAGFSYTQEGVGMPVSATRYALGLYDHNTLTPYMHKAQSHSDLHANLFGEIY